MMIWIFTALYLAGMVLLWILFIRGHKTWGATLREIMTFIPLTFFSWILVLWYWFCLIWDWFKTNWNRTFKL